MSDKQTELKPCPHCGGSDLRAHRDEGIRPMAALFAVICHASTDTSNTGEAVDGKDFNGRQNHPDEPYKNPDPYLFGLPISTMLPSLADDLSDEAFALKQWFDSIAEQMTEDGVKIGMMTIGEGRRAIATLERAAASLRALNPGSEAREPDGFIQYTKGSSGNVGAFYKGDPREIHDNPMLETVPVYFHRPPVEASDK